MTRRLIPSVVVAGVTSALAITINIATSPEQPWWAWAAVVVLTCVTGLLSYRTQRTSEPQPRPAVDEPAPAPTATTNTISGTVSGNVVQAERIDGGISF